MAVGTMYIRNGSVPRSQDWIEILLLEVSTRRMVSRMGVYSDFREVLA
jgi:hypothetical protein